MLVAFLDEHEHCSGSEPIYRVLSDNSEVTRAPRIDGRVHKAEPICLDNFSAGQQGCRTATAHGVH